MVKLTGRKMLHTRVWSHEMKLKIVDINDGAYVWRMKGKLYDHRTQTT